MHSSFLTCVVLEQVETVPLRTKCIPLSTPGEDGGRNSPGCEPPKRPSQVGPPCPAAGEGLPQT